MDRSVWGGWGINSQYERERKMVSKEWKIEFVGSPTSAGYNRRQPQTPQLLQNSTTFRVGPPTTLISSHTTTMLQRSTQRLFPAIGRRAIGARSYSSFTTDNTIPANSPQQPTRRSPVSSTNALPTVAHGAQDEALVEQAEEAEHKRVMQAPNRATVWSRSQKPRAEAMVGPRFEQTIMEDQV